MGLFVAATRQNDGKTAVSMGLLSVLSSMTENIGYMKPIGQQYRVVDGQKIDKDAVLMQNIFGFESSLQDMSPVAIPQGFTEQYILHGQRQELVDSIQTAYSRLKQVHDFVLVEGTGHAGVGSVFDLSNANVASLLGSKVILVARGGLGAPIDELALNHAMFQLADVSVIGVIINKVQQQKYDKINSLVRKGLARKGIDVLGVLPFEHILSSPTVKELCEDLSAELICGREYWHNLVESFVIGDGPSGQKLDYDPGTLLIVPGNRSHFLEKILREPLDQLPFSAIVVTYGHMPKPELLEKIQDSAVPLLMVEDDSFTTACKINSMIFKVRAEDKGKIAKIESLVKEYVDVPKIFEQVT